MKMRDEVWDATQPEDRLQEETALGIVRLMWLKRRLMRTSQLAYYKDSQSASASPQDWDGLLASITAAATEKGSLSKTIKTSIDELKTAIEKLSSLNMALVSGHNIVGPPKDAFAAAQKALSDAQYCDEILGKQVFPRMCKLEEVQKAPTVTVYDSAYSADNLDKLMRIEAALDARIDKQLARLANLKEYRRLTLERVKDVQGTASVPAIENASKEDA